ncbi:RidA family protein [Nitratireductor pacificus]|uniref:Putative translation initiation inhibitor, yjgF family protein n=1 Tax=Nitratireductor pacificus pht-3B TaxID=391937 RepID=K2MTI7_9HYPH|nr:RidA family protein [Nitratireductor pacificus]EKF20637.1 putative translation initiation inhibitor, yjgF family protein [Nitratireductor pacificus pht-3B]
MTIDLIETAEAALPLGHYSQAAAHRGTLYLSGILPVALDGDTLAVRPFDEQVDLVLAHAGAILSKAGATVADIVKVSIYMTDISNWTSFDARYARFVGNHRPARAVIPVPALHHGFDVEIELIAAVKG